jgi:hypothetical protein
LNDGFATGVRFAGDFKIILEFDQVAQSLAHNCMIFHQQNRDSFHKISMLGFSGRRQRPPRVNLPRGMLEASTANRESATLSTDGFSLYMG